MLSKILNASELTTWISVWKKDNECETKTIETVTKIIEIID